MSVRRTSGGANAAELTSFGAAGEVTGSCHRLRLEGGTTLIDCGAFQGGAAQEARNAAPFPFDPAEIDAVLLTHAHLDHVGRLPTLVRSGFRGEVVAPPGARAVAETILRDAAKLAAEDHARELRKARRSGHEDRVRPPPFGDDEVDAVLARLREVPYDRPFDLPGARATLRRAGHVLGSAWLAVDPDDGSGRLVFSGDLGPFEGPLHPGPDPLDGARFVLCEGTYGDRDHRDLAATRAEFADVVGRACAAGGRVLIPAFALGRAQTILAELARLQRSGALPVVPVVLDSPMAARLTQAYRSHPDAFLPALRDRLEAGDDPFAPPAFEATASAEASRSLNDREGPLIVIAGSGMMTGGRIVHHLRHHLWKADTRLLVTGFQAYGSLGRTLVDGARRIRLFGESVVVRASVHTVGGFSAHAGRSDLTAWLDGAPDATVRLVHGEPKTLRAFAAHLKDHARAAGRGRDVRPSVEGRPLRP